MWLTPAGKNMVGIRALRDDVHWSDVWFYGVIPPLLFLGHPPIV
jgi:hypothetical protein